MHARLTITGHLNELRQRIIVSLVFLGITTIASFPFSNYTLGILKQPAAGYIKTLAFFSPQDAFSIHLRVAFLLGFIIALPLVLYEIWAFVSPAVEERFKKYTLKFILSCVSAFLIGCLFCYFVLLPTALRFLLSFAKANLIPVISAQNYISFVLGLLIGCGLTFQMPVLSFIFTKIGLINAKFLKEKRKFAILFIFIIAAIITPTTDAFNLLILAIPMLILYEFSIYVSRWAK